MHNIVSHQLNCCENHGCNYKEEACPVVAGTLKKSHSCSACAIQKKKIQEKKHYLFDLIGKWSKSSPNSTNSEFDKGYKLAMKDSADDLLKFIKAHL